MDNSEWKCGELGKKHRLNIVKEHTMFAKYEHRVHPNNSIKKFAKLITSVMINCGRNSFSKADRNEIFTLFDTIPYRSILRWIIE